MPNKAPNAQGSKKPHEKKLPGADLDPRDNIFASLAIFNKEASVPPFLALFA